MWHLRSWLRAIYIEPNFADTALWRGFVLFGLWHSAPRPAGRGALASCSSWRTRCESERKTWKIYPTENDLENWRHWAILAISALTVPGEKPMLHPTRCCRPTRFPWLKFEESRPFGRRPWWRSWTPWWIALRPFQNSMSTTWSSRLAMIGCRLRQRRWFRLRHPMECERPASLFAATSLRMWALRRLPLKMDVQKLGLSTLGASSAPPWDVSWDWLVEEAGMQPLLMCVQPFSWLLAKKRNILSWSSHSPRGRSGHWKGKMGYPKGPLWLGFQSEKLGGLRGWGVPCSDLEDGFEILLADPDTREEPVEDLEPPSAQRRSTTFGCHWWWRSLHRRLCGGLCGRLAHHWTTGGRWGVYATDQVSMGVLRTFLGELWRTRFCGLELRWREDHLLLGQLAYAKELGQRHGTLPLRTTPLPKIDGDMEPETDIKIEDVRKAELLWLSVRTRPDLSYAISLMGRRVTKCLSWAMFNRPGTRP